MKKHCEYLAQGNEVLSDHCFHRNSLYRGVSPVCYYKASHRTTRRIFLSICGEDRSSTNIQVQVNTTISWTWVTIIEKQNKVQISGRRKKVLNINVWITYQCMEKTKFTIINELKRLQDFEQIITNFSVSVKKVRESKTRMVTMEK